MNVDAISGSVPGQFVIGVSAPNRASAAARSRLASCAAVSFVRPAVADPETLTKRLLQRAAEQHRADDNPESIAERLAEYRELSTPVLDYYRQRGVPVLEIDGSGSVDEVHRRIVDALRGLRN